MKAVVLREEGGPDVLRLENMPDPVPGPGEVLVRLAAASLNHLDVWVRKGLPSVPKPRILGADGAGIVEALGAEVGGLAPGDRVLINPGIWEDGKLQVPGENRDGTHAELVAIPARNVNPIPGGLSFEEAAAFPLVHLTAYRMLATRARVEQGETVLVWGIGGGVATSALTIAKALGARVIVTSSSPAKLAHALALGADAGIDHVAEDVRARVRELTDGRGCDVVVDSVGEATWKTTVEVAAREGRIVVCGATSGSNPPAALHRIFWKELTVLGSTSGTEREFAAVLELVASGRARPVVDRVYPLAQAAAAHRRLEAGEQLGKIILRIPD